MNTTDQPLNQVKTGDQIIATVTLRTGRQQTIHGEVVRIYSMPNGDVSFVTVITGQSANRSKRYVDRHNVVSVAIA